MADKRTGAERIADERKRQIGAEGWTRKHDAEEHASGELVRAALAYASHAIGTRVYEKVSGLEYERFADPFPDDWEDKRPRNADGRLIANPKKAARVRMLEKAGALIAAEIDRLLRRNS